MPRPNRRRPERTDLDLGRALGSAARRQSQPDGEWFVRPVAGEASGKNYRCPGCQQLVPAGQPHVVAWPADGPVSDASALGDRRHWHSPCWDARGRRGSR